jgi:hypothetical protein
MTNKWQWQPFTPKVRVNAQAVINEDTVSRALSVADFS